MSYSTLITFRNGVAECDTEFQNAWGTGPMVWDALMDRYESVLWPEEHTSHRTILDTGRLFERNAEIGMRDWETWTYLFHCDNSVVRREAFKELANALDQFHRAHSKPNRVCHLGAIASRLRHLASDEDVHAAALWCTSVCSNPWADVGEDEERIAYDLSEGERHWFVDDEARRRHA